MEYYDDRTVKVIKVCDHILDSSIGTDNGNVEVMIMTIMKMTKFTLHS